MKKQILSAIALSLSLGSGLVPTCAQAQPSYIFRQLIPGLAKVTPACVTKTINLSTSPTNVSDWKMAIGYYPKPDSGTPVSGFMDTNNGNYYGCAGYTNLSPSGYYFSPDDNTNTTYYSYWNNFSIPTGCTSGTLSVSAAGDDGVAAIFLNGKALFVSSTYVPNGDPDFTGISTYCDVPSQPTYTGPLQPGENQLVVVNYQGNGGVGMYAHAVAAPQ